MSSCLYLLLLWEHHRLVSCLLSAKNLVTNWEQTLTDDSNTTSNLWYLNGNGTFWSKITRRIARNEVQLPLYHINFETAQLYPLKRPVFFFFFFFNTKGMFWWHKLQNSVQWKFVVHIPEMWIVTLKMPLNSLACFVCRVG